MEHLNNVTKNLSLPPVVLVFRLVVLNHVEFGQWMGGIYGSVGW